MKRGESPTVEIHTVNNMTGKKSRTSIPVAYTTTDWAVHRPHESIWDDGTVQLKARGWVVTCRHSGMRAWQGTNLQTAKKTARALQKATDQHGRIPSDGQAPPAVLIAHAQAAGHQQEGEAA